MLTGETIVSLEKSGKSYMARGPRLNVVLEKNGKRRLADWNYYGTVSVRSEKKMKVKIKIDHEPWKRMGITRKQGGSGIHQDRRTKRQRTRQAQKQRWVND